MSIIIFQQRRLKEGALPPALAKWGQWRQWCLFDDNILGNFMVYQEWFETKLLRLFAHPENSEWFSIISVIVFDLTLFLKQK